MKTILFLSAQLLFSSFLFSEVSAIYNDDKVEISWTNPVHIKVDHFVIERSKNGKYFKEIMKVSGSKNINEIIEYYEIDHNPFKSKAYYRIKQVTTDGQNYYSNIVVAENFNHAIKPTFNLFDNSGKVRSMKAYNEKDVLVVLSDTKNNQYIAKVSLTIENKRLIVSNANITLPTGTYLVTGTSDDLIYGKKIIVEGIHSNPS